MATTIRYGKTRSSLGPLVAARSDRGLVTVAFGDSTDSIETDLQARFSHADVIEDCGAVDGALARICALIDQPDIDLDLALDLHGSEFEIRVWNALREIPVGATANYGEIAARLGAPRAAREVAEACAANALAVVVPCHRVVKKDGSISGYRWGVWRKRALIERERRVCLLPRRARDLRGTLSKTQEGAG